MTESFRASDGRLVAYRVEGTGPVLVCHPGGPGFSSRYLGDLAGLSQECTLVLLDPRGTGGSDKPVDPTSYRLEDYAADVEQLREHLDVARVCLLGHSHGGFVGAVYASTFHERVERLVLASTFTRFSDELRAAQQAAFDRHASESWYPDAIAARKTRQAFDFSDSRELAGLYIREFPLYLARLGTAERAFLELLRDEEPNADALRFFNEQLSATYDVRPRLPAIAAPTLVIVGERDPGVVANPEFLEGIRQVRAVSVPDAGHFPHVEAPARFRSEVLSFLS